ncbi:TetR/AcrR family transcriptional regulator [Denitrobaculum tricleocarpae]|uniref:TetR/AcrR family transcriptional regulator n=1 Tax=Denitrobaculum tricleocarpae TaxID=2591009 RepID=UPI001C55115D|nr:TetR/AcrR family transcriptional regulator [Denitrobaculum tricleocarpae]
MNEKPNGHARRRAAKRAEILTAATEIFFEEGYGRASMDAVLVRTGGSKRTLYKYFHSKDELFAAIVSNVSDRVLAALRPPLEDGDIRETLTTMGERYLGVLLSPEGLALYRNMVAEAPYFPELAETFFSNGPGRASCHLAAFLRDRKARAGLQIEDPQRAAEQFLGMVRGDVHLSAVLEVRRPAKTAVRKAVATAVDIFLVGTAPDVRKG